MRGQRALALTGAGCSTESGIPDYRGPSADGQPRAPRTPIMFRDFVSSARARQRYWARSVRGWPALANARPNQAHSALAALELAGGLVGVITQNVDGLHAAAGSRRLVELHGKLAQVRCLVCAAMCDRAELQERLLARNPGWLERAAALAPDGDAELDGEAVADFAVEDCAGCGGPLKPDVVFFGENVPRNRVERCYQLIDDADAVLVLGSSLTVMSGFRFVRHAAKSGTPVLIINQGLTRGDPYAAHRVNLPLGKALNELTDLL